jgi:hypothetical protein
MEILAIRIEDTDSTAPALTLHYTLGPNSLDTAAVAASIYNLSTHPGRARTIPDEPGTVEVVPCSETFLTTFWSAAASLLDYFADFHTTDTPVMQSVWYHLLDTWQACAAHTLALYKQDCDFWTFEARDFTKDYEETLELFARLVGQPQEAPRNWGGHAEEKHAEALIHAPDGRVEARAGLYETGPWVSGLKPWQQFLLAGAPGFALTSSDEGGEEEQGGGGVARDAHTRFVPQPAIALMQAHTTRARALLTEYHTKHDPSNLNERLAAFDSTALAFPSITHREYTAQSCVSHSTTVPNTTYTYSLHQAAPPVRRHEGFSDPSMMIEPPTLLRLDEAVGNCKGSEAYVPMTGPRGEDGVGFDVWAVQESQFWPGENGLDRDGEVLNSCSEVFDEWEFGRNED